MRAEVRGFLYNDNGELVPATEPDEVTNENALEWRVVLAARVTDPRLGVEPGEPVDVVNVTHYGETEPWLVFAVNSESFHREPTGGRPYRATFRRGRVVGADGKIDPGYGFQMVVPPDNDNWPPPRRGGSGSSGHGPGR